MSNPNESKTLAGDRIAFALLLDVLYANGVRPDDMIVSAHYGQHVNSVCLSWKMAQAGHVEAIPPWLPAQYRDKWRVLYSGIVLEELHEIGAIDGEAPVFVEATVAAWKSFGRYVWWLRLWRDGIESALRARGKR